MRICLRHIALVLIVLIPVIASAQPRVGDALIRNGTLLTVTKGTLENTDLLIRDGKIAAIGRNLTAPEGCRIIDATGLFVMPGITDAHSHIALEALNEMSSPVTPEIRMRAALHPP